MGYCDNTPDDMLPEGSSPLKARYTSSGYLKDLDVITLPKAKKKDTPPPSPSKKPTPPEKKGKGKGFVFVPNTPKTDLNPDYSITVSSTEPSKTKYSGGGTLKNQAEKDFYDKEVKRLGGVQQYRDYYKIGKKITTPGGSSSISGKTKVKTSDKKGDIVLGGYKKNI